VNPFADEASAVGANVERQVFVPAAWAEKCIKAAPCEDWRIIIAFARYAGMRSHETRMQRWEDIDIPNARMIVRIDKTPPTRVCPIFPELMPHIRRAREYAPPGAEFVQTRYTPQSNIGTTFTKIVERAGLVPWDKLFQNMRATRETELMAVYPAKDVA
jgi:integrase